MNWHIRRNSILLTFGVAATLALTACQPPADPAEVGASAAASGETEPPAAPATPAGRVVSATEARQAADALKQVATSTPAGLPDLATTLAFRPAFGTDRAYRGITFLFTGQTEANLEVCGCPKDPMGGIAPRASVIEETRKANEGRVVVLDAGRLLTPCGGMDALRNEAYLHLVGEIGYDALALSTADLQACGYRFLKRVAATNNLPFVSANLEFEDGAERFWKPYQLIERDGLTFAVIGFSEQLERLPTEDGVLRANDAGPAIARIIDEVTGQVDFIIALGSLGHGQGQLPLQKIAEAAPGLDVLIGAIPGTRERRVGQTLVYTIVPEGRELGRLDVNFFTGGDRYTQMRNVPLGKELEREPHIRAMLSAFYRDIMASEEYGSRAVNIHAGLPEESMGDNAYVGHEACQDCHKVEYRVWQSSRHRNAFLPLLREKTYFVPECLPCHTTGYGLPTGFGSGEDETLMREVQCEACHGPGKKHVESEGEVNMTRSTMDVDFCARCHQPDRRPCLGKELSVGLLKDPKGYFETIAH